MTLKTYDFEGQTQGTTATQSNTGTNAFVAGGGIIFDAAAAVHGLMGLKITSSSNAQALVRSNANATNLTMAFGHAIAIPQSVPANGNVLISYRNSGGPAAKIAYTSLGLLIFQNAAGAQVGSPLCTAAQLTAGAIYYVTAELATTATANTGTYVVRVYDNTGTQVGSTVSGSGANLGTAVYTGADVGFVDTLHIAGLVTSTDWHQYNDGSTAQVTVPTWGATPVTPVTRSTTWDTLATVTVSRSTSWNAGAPVSASRATTWDVLTSVSTSRASTWDTDTRVTTSRSSSWNAGASVNVTRSTSWAALAGVAAATRPTTWDTLAKVTATRSTTWTTTARVSASRATSWSARSTVAASRSTSWNVAGTLASVSTSRATTWRALASVTASRSTTWQTRATVNTSRATTWDVLDVDVTERATSWGTLALSVVYRSSTWNAGAPVDAYRSTSWAVHRDTVNDRDITVTFKLADDPFGFTLDPDPLAFVLDGGRFTFTMEEGADMRTVRSSTGNRVYVSGVLTEVTGKPLAGTTFAVSIGTPTDPGTEHDPDVVETISASSVRLKLLVGHEGTVDPDPGDYQLAATVTDDPEIETVFTAGRVKVI